MADGVRQVRYGLGPGGQKPGSGGASGRRRREVRTVVGRRIGLLSRLKPEVPVACGSTVECRDALDAQVGHGSTAVSEGIRLRGVLQVG